MGLFKREKCVIELIADNKRLSEEISMQKCITAELREKLCEKVTDYEADAIRHHRIIAAHERSSKQLSEEISIQKVIIADLQSKIDDANGLPTFQMWHVRKYDGGFGGEEITVVLDRMIDYLNEMVKRSLSK